MLTRRVPKGHQVGSPTLPAPSVPARIGSQRPRLQQIPRRAHGSAGDDAIAWALRIGWNDEDGHGFYESIDDWQQWCIRGLLSEDENAQLCALIVLILVPRQNGKNVVLEIVELYAFYVLGLRHILHTAHLQETSASHMARLWDAIQSDDRLADITQRVVANGKERIYRTDRPCQIVFKTRSKKIGRGGSPQMVVFDEALYLTDLQVQALLPSLSAQTMRGDPPILIYTSSAPVGESEVVHRLRRQLAAGNLPDTFYAEWSAELPTDDDRHAALIAMADDIDLLFDTNPSMNVRIDPAWIASVERATMSVEAYCIERLGVVFESDGESGVIPAHQWRQCVDKSSQCAEGRASLHVGPNGSWAAFGFAGIRSDGSLHVEVARHEQGTAWIESHALKVNARRGAIVVDPRSSTSGVLARLRLAGVEFEELTTPQVVQACTAMQDDVANIALHHLDQPELNAAVVGVDIRPMGESWIFSPKASTVDITPLYAVTLAAFAARGKATAPVFIY